MRQNYPSFQQDFLLKMCVKLDYFQERPTLHSILRNILVLLDLKSLRLLHQTSRFWFYFVQDSLKSKDFRQQRLGYNWKNQTPKYVLYPSLLPNLLSCRLLSCPSERFISCFCSDAKTLVVGGTWKNWRKPLLFTYQLGGDMAKGLTLGGHAGTVTAVVMGGEVIVSGGADKQVIVWRREDGMKIASLEDHQVRVPASSALQPLFSSLRSPL